MFSRYVITWLVISAVAVYDTYLTVKHAEIMRDAELNPIAAYVIRSSGGVALLVALKTAGVALALLLSFILWQRQSLRRKMLGCSLCVAVIQLMLLGFLLADFRCVRPGKIALRWSFLQNGPEAKETPHYTPANGGSKHPKPEMLPRGQ